MEKNCTQCGQKFANQAVKFCPECGTKRVQAASTTKSKKLEVTPIVNRIPEFDGWKRVDLTQAAEYSDDQQLHYDRMIGIMIARETFFEKKQEFRLLNKANPKTFLGEYVDRFLVGFMKSVEKHGFLESTARVGMIDYMSNVILADNIDIAQIPMQKISIPVFEKWPPSGKPKNTFVIHADGVSIESKWGGNTSRNWSQISSLGFGQSQYYEQQGFGSSLYVALTLTLRCKNGEVFERHYLYGVKEADINAGRVFTQSVIGQIQQSGLPVQLVDDNGYNASGGYSVGVGVWF